MTGGRRRIPVTTSFPNDSHHSLRSPLLSSDPADFQQAVSIKGKTGIFAFVNDTNATTSDALSAFGNTIPATHAATARRAFPFESGSTASSKTITTVSAPQLRGLLERSG